MRSLTIAATVFPVCFTVIALMALASCTASVPRFRSHAGEAQSPERHGADPDTSARLPGSETPVDLTAALPEIAANARANSSIDVRRVLDEILTMIGTPYAAAGDGTGGVDCSGFTSRIYRDAIGAALPRSTAEQFQVGSSVAEDEFRFGDLVFFNTTGEIPSHVGIYLGEDLFAHASVSSGVTISSLASRYYRERYVGARRPLP